MVLTTDSEFTAELIFPAATLSLAVVSEQTVFVFRGRFLTWIILPSKHAGTVTNGMGPSLPATYPRILELPNRLISLLNYLNPLLY